MPHRKTPLVSIGLPVFNGERYLAEAVESVLTQDFEDFEMILCDNGSTDGTRGICERFVAADPRVRYEGSETNRGAAWNYTRAVDLAEGRYFRWMTHDDRLAPTCVRKCLEVLREREPEVVLVYPRTALIDAEGSPVGVYEDRSECLSDRPHERIRVLLRNLVLCNAVVGLMPLQVLRGTRRIGRWSASDKTLLIELALRGKIVEVPERLFLRRRDPRLPSPSNMTPEQRARWYDSTARVSRFQRWAQVREIHRAVSLSPLRLSARVRCHLTATRDAIRHRRALLRELFQGTRSMRSGVDGGGAAAPSGRAPSP